MIPQQIIDVLEGNDVLLVPPASEGTQETASEKFAVEHFKSLVDLGLVVARDTAPDDKDATWLLFNPDHFDADTIHQYAITGRLAEFVNGEGNNQKPEDPTHIVNVTHAKTGESTRDILVNTPEQAKAAIAKNAGPERNVALNPWDPDSGKAVIRNRIQNIGAIPDPTGGEPQ